MKLSISCCSLLALVVLTIFLKVDLHAQTPEPRVLSEQPFQPTEKGLNHRLLHSEKWVVEASGETNQITTSYVELASGLHYQDEQGEYQLSDPTIQIAPDGTFAAASRLEQPVTFEANLNTQGAVRILTPDGHLLKATVLALAYYDPVSGADVVLGVVKDSIGQVVDGNKIVYPQAFTNLDADVIYEVSATGIMQMVALQKAPPPPEEFGLSPLSYLEVMTEFFDPPVPNKKEEILDKVKDPQLRAQMAAPDFVDEELTFGQSRIGKGTAFWRDNPLEDGPGPREDHPVGKRWRFENGRTLLYESTEIPAIKAELDRLPKADWNGAWLEQKRNGEVAHIKDRPRTVPPPHYALKNLKHTLQIAQVDAQENESSPLLAAGLILDWSISTLSGSLNNYTFDAATTYYVSGQLNLNGVTTMEGGTVIKLGPGTSPSLRVNGSFVSKASLYRPITITARDDNTIGAIVSGSDGNPGTEKFGDKALYFLGTTDVAVEHIRFRHHTTAVAFHNSSTKTRSLRHAQILNCTYALWNRYDTTLQIDNCLVVNCSDAVFYSYQNADFHAVNLTANGAVKLLHNFSGVGSITLENTLLVNIGTLTSYTNQGASHNVELSSASGVFSDVGAGGHYLAAGSPYRDIGIAVDTDLTRDFKQMTTYTPTVVQDITIAADTLWGFAVERDYEHIDLGYHYPAVDYAVNDVEIGGSPSQAAVLSILPGVSIASFGDHGLRPMTYGGLIAKGTQTQKINLVRYTTVQEQIEDWGGTAYSSYPPTSLVGNWGDYNSALTYPTVELRFVDFHQPADYGRTFFSGNGWWAFAEIDIRDCGFYGGEAKFSGVSNVTVSTVKVQNNLFRRSMGFMGDWGTTEIRNNLFWNSSFTLGFLSAGGTKTVKDNTFDATVITQTTTNIMVHGDNGYLNGASRIYPTQGSDIVIATFSHQSGPLGEYYQPTTTTLINQGSQNATLSGLYHHTIFTTANSKEGNTTVDIGFHYVGTDSNGDPIDTDGDGIPDYLEDANGNNVVDTGAGETNPGSSENGTTSGDLVQVYTMLD